MDREQVSLLVAMMESDHRRQHALLERIGQSLGEGYVDQVRLALAEFAVRLNKHIKIENSLLAPALGMPSECQIMASLEDMQAEHAEIMTKLSLVELRLEEHADASQLNAAWRDFISFFSRHEMAEEAHLFPYWQHALAELPADASATLFRRVRETHQAAF